LLAPLVLWPRRDKSPLLTLAINHFQDSFQVLEDLGVPITQHFQAFALEIGLPDSVLLFLPQMRLAINLDYQGGYSTIEIGNVRVNNVLAPEAIAPEAPAPKLGTQDLFSRSHFATKSPSISD